MARSQLTWEPVGADEVLLIEHRVVGAQKPETGPLPAAGEQTGVSRGQTWTDVNRRGQTGVSRGQTGTDGCQTGAYGRQTGTDADRWASNELRREQTSVRRDRRTADEDRLASNEYRRGSDEYRRGQTSVPGTNGRSDGDRRSRDGRG